MPDTVRQLVPDCSAFVCKSTLARKLCIDKRDLKQTSARGATKLSERNINPPWELKLDTGEHRTVFSHLKHP